MKSSRHHVSDAVILRRKKSVRRDATYHEGQENRGRKRGTNGSVIYMRSDTQKLESTAVLMNERVLRESNLSPRKIQRELASKVAGISSNRPVVAMDDPLSPKVVTTPGGRQLSRIASLKSFSVFAEMHPFKLPDPSPLQKTSVDPSFFASSTYQAVKKPTTIIKEQEAVITDEIIKEVRKENKVKRRKKQSSAMVEEGYDEKEASATRYVQATELFSGNMVAEWGHVLARRFKGESSTIMENLVAITYDMNTMMAYVEDEIQALAKLYPQGLRVKNRAELIEGTHFAPVIYMTILTDDFKMPFMIKVADLIKPNIILKDYIRSIMQVMVAVGKSKRQPFVDNHSADQPMGSPISSLLFFNSDQEGSQENQENGLRIR